MNTLQPATFFRETPEGVILNVRAQPRSPRAGLEGVVGDAVRVRVRSAPVDGKANHELVGTLAEAFGIPKSAVSFKGGETSRTKRLLLGGVSAARVRALFGSLVLMLLFAGCWTFGETPFPQAAVVAAPAGKGVFTVAVTGFESVLTEYEAIHGFTTVYVPGYMGPCHVHPGYYETVPALTYVPQRRATDMFRRRAEDALEEAGYVLAAGRSDYAVDVSFDGPFPSTEDQLTAFGWNVLTLFFCDYAAAHWTARLRLRETKTGRLVLHRDYDQRFETHVFGLVPLFGISSSDATRVARLQTWCLAALTDRALADVTAFLAKVDSAAP